MVCFKFSLYNSCHFFAYTDNFYQKEYISHGGDGVLSPADVWRLLNTEIYDPFVWILFLLGVVVFPIMGWLELEKKIK